MNLSSGIMRMKELRKNNDNISLGVDGSNILEEMRICFLLHRLHESKDPPSG